MHFSKDILVKVQFLLNELKHVTLKDFPFKQLVVLVWINFSTRI